MKFFLVALLLALFHAFAIALPGSEIALASETNEIGPAIPGTEFTESEAEDSTAYSGALAGDTVDSVQVSLPAVAAKRPYCECSGELWCFLNGIGHKKMGDTSKTYPVSSDEVCSEDFCKAKLAQEAREFQQKDPELLVACAHYRIKWKETWK